MNSNDSESKKIHSKYNSKYNDVKNILSDKYTIIKSELNSIWRSEKRKNSIKNIFFEKKPRVDFHI